MTNFEYGGIGSSQKKLFAMLAVVLMIGSAGVVLLVADQPSVAEADKNEPVDKPVTITYENGAWKLDTEIAETIVSLDGNVVTINGLNTDVKGADYAYAISIEGGDGETTSLTIKVVGENSVIYRPVQGTQLGISIKNADVKIIGEDRSKDKLSIQIDKIEKYGATAIFGNNSKLTIDGVGLSITTGDAYLCIGINIPDLSITNSTVKVVTGSASNERSIGMVASNSLTISKSTVDVKVGWASGFASIGISAVNKLNVTDSVLNVNSGELLMSVPSIGIRAVTGADVSFANSKITSTAGQYSAFAMTDDVKSVELKPMPTSYFGSLSLIGKVLDGSYEKITGQTIDLKYTTVVAGVAHKVTYNLNGGSGTAPSQDNVIEGEKFYITSVVPTRDGYTFKGWLAPDNKIYTGGSEYLMGTSDIVMKAQWEKNSSGGDDNTALYIGIAVVIVVIIAALAAYFFYFKKQ